MLTLECKGSSPDKWQVSRTASLGDPVTAVLEYPRDGTLFASPLLQLHLRRREPQLTQGGIQQDSTQIILRRLPKAKGP